MLQKCSWRGFEVADIIPEMKVSNVVVCTITHIEQHPNAERLRVCNIDIGAENELVIVTNAANVYEGCQVPLRWTVRFLRTAWK